MTAGRSADNGLAAVCETLKRSDPNGERIASVLRNTIDQLYDGQRTGRYRWEQLYKTEKTHCGTLVEINLHREFKFQDGTLLDYCIAEMEVDCKYTQELYGWMIPPEALGHLCLLVWAHDESSAWKMGIIRPDASLLGAKNRDGKAKLNAAGRAAIDWIFENGILPPNVLLQLDRTIVNKIMGLGSGQKRINELFRNTLGHRVGRGVVATVAQQDDYMKRVRGNGGARTALRPEGVIILGQFRAHCEIAEKLGAPIPGRGESIALRLHPATSGDKQVAIISGRLWRIANSDDDIVPGPKLARPKNSKNSPHD